MTEQRQHTKLPWSIGPNEPSFKSLGKLNLYEIGGEASATWNCMVLADEHGEANARLIVKSVNSAGKLAEALRELTGLVFDLKGMGLKDWSQALKESTNRAESALRLWEEGK
jgi:hypothetical protein